MLVKGALKANLHHLVKFPIDASTVALLSITWDPFYLHGLTSILAWISNYILYDVWAEITYPFLNFNGATVEV